MSPADSSPVRRGEAGFALYYFGAVLVVALILGGGTQKFLPTVFAVQLLILPLSFSLFAGLDERGGPLRGTTLLLLATLAVFIAQLLPLGLVPRDGIPALGLQPGAAVTLDVGRTLDSLGFVAVAALVFLFVVQLHENDLNRLLRFLFLGVVINMTVSLVQFAATQRLEFSLFPYELGAGFFANQNHFSALLFVAIPFVVYQCTVMRRAWVAIPIIGLILFVQFAAGSLAGIFISLGCAALSFAFLGRTGALAQLLLVLGCAIAGILLAANPGNILQFDSDSPLGRPAIFATSWAALLANLPWGGGFGTFPLVYPQFEGADQIRYAQINHAHNEYLELFIEGGAPAMLLLLGYAALMARHVTTAVASPLRRAALLALLFLLVHSLVDYPLRTMALVTVFAMLNGIYFSTPPAAAGLVRKTSQG